MEPQEYLRSIILPLIENDLELKIVHSQDDQGVLYTINVAERDMGKILGRGGDTAKAIRHIMRQFGLPRAMRISLKILEPENSTFNKNI